MVVLVNIDMDSANTWQKLGITMTSIKPMCTTRN